MSKYLKPPVNPILPPKRKFQSVANSETIEKRRLPLVPKTLSQLADLNPSKIRPIDVQSAALGPDEQTFHAFIDRVMKLKAKMTLKKISRANCICNECGGTWDARIVGTKKHIWMHCSGCSRRFME